MAVLLFSNNAQSRLAGSISNVATTAVLSAGTGVLFPNPTAGDSFRLTFTDAATGQNHEIVSVTARSGDTITIARGQEGTTGQAWLAGDFAEGLCTAGLMQSFIQGPQSPGGTTKWLRADGWQPLPVLFLTGVQTFYCNWTSGDDSTGDGTVGNPWKSLQHTYDWIATNVYAGSFNVTIDQVAGVDTGGLNAASPVASPLVVVQLNGGINTANEDGVKAGPGVRIAVQGTGTIRGAVNDIQAFGGYVTFQGVTLGACTGTKVSAIAHGIATITGDYSDIGNADSHYVTGTGGLIDVNTTAILHLLSTPAYSVAFAQASQSATAVLANMTWDGNAAGVAYITNTAGGVWTNGGGLPSGLTAGTATAPGWYN